MFCFFESKYLLHSILYYFINKMIYPMIEANKQKRHLHTFPHELALAVVHDLLRDEGVVHHGIFLHVIEATVLLSKVQLILS